MDQVLEKHKSAVTVLEAPLAPSSSRRTDDRSGICNRRAASLNRVTKTLGAFIDFWLDRDVSTPLQAQLYQQLREAISTGRLSPGRRLPGTRYLAQELNCSRNTILGCFEELTSEGYLEGHSGSGTYVAKVLPEDVTSDAAFPKSAAKVTDIDLSNRGQYLAAFKQAQRGHQAAFQCSPDVSLFPFEQWERLSRVWRRPTPSLTSVRDPGGYLPLRESICNHLRTARMIECKPEQVLITAGDQHGIDLVARLLLDPGDVVWVEDGGHPGPYCSLYAAGATVVRSACDREGLRLDRSWQSRPPRMIVVTPSHHFSLGCVTSLQRRLELLDFAAEVDSWIIETDYNSEFRYSGRNLVPLHRLDGGERVVYVGTFSNLLFPTLELGFIVVPQRIMERFATGYAELSRPAILAQPVVDAFMREGHFDAHVRRMRVTYRNRQTFLLEAIEKHLSRFLLAQPASVGMHIAAYFTPEASERFCDREVAQRAAACNVIASSLSQFYADKPDAKGLILGFTAVNEKGLVAGVHQLARVLRT